MGMKGYKAFDKGLICRGKQYAENTVFEESGADKCCEAGAMHFCEEPLAVLDYYDLVDNDGDMPEFAEVEALDEVLSDGNKRATKKLKIGARLKIKDLIEAQIKFVSKKCGKGTATAKDRSRLAASGNWSHLAASGNWSHLAASGDGSHLAASGNWSRLAASGDGSHLAASGNWSHLAASGNWSHLAASGNGSRLAASGYESQLAASGNWSRLAASGNWSRLAASGYASRLAASGNASQLAASGNASRLAANGDWSRLAASGYESQLAASGNESQLAASGNWSRLAANGENSVIMASGQGSIAKAKKGGWITLAEWARIDDKYVPVCVKTGHVGDDLKPDTWYRLENGEFVEVDDD